MEQMWVLGEFRPISKPSTSGTIVNLEALENYATKEDLANATTKESDYSELDEILKIK